MRSQKISKPCKGGTGPRAAGRRDEARDSFEKALAQARGAGLFRDMLKGQPNHYEDRLEGKIAAALLLLDPPLSASDGERGQG